MEHETLVSLDAHPSLHPSELFPLNKDIRFP